MIIRYILIFCCLPLWLIAQQSKPVKTTYPGIVVIELFTSQGDINSPAADQVLSDIIADYDKKNKNVYCLSMHVDFWNRYGWMDPYSNLKYTRRLTNYTSILGMKETYTPFMILNGRTVLPISDKKKIMENIATGLSINALVKPDFTFSVFDDTLDISYDLAATLPANKSGSDKYINIAIVEKGLATIVTKGDNQGKILKNDNVTRLFFTTDLKTSKGLIRMPLRSVKPDLNKSIILYIQEKSTKKIIGASASVFTVK